MTVHPEITDPSVRHGMGWEPLDSAETFGPPGVATPPLPTVQLSTVEPRQVDWLWRGYIPLRKVTILDGDPGLGKSTLLVDLASRLSVGGQTPTGEPLGPPAVTVYVTAEDEPEDTILPRVLKAGGDARRIYVVAKLTLPEDVDKLAATIARWRARLAVIDPLVAYLGDSVKTNEDHRVRRALEPLASMAQAHDCAIVAVRHLNKRAGEGALYRGGGSIGFSGLARAVLAVGRDPEDEERIVLAGVKLNVARRPDSLAYRIVADGPYAPAGIAWEGVTHHTAEDLIGTTREQAGERSQTARMAEAMAETLQANGGEMLAADGYRALEAAGINLASRSSVQRARDQARIATVKKAFDGPWYWTWRQ